MIRYLCVTFLVFASYLANHPSTAEVCADEFEHNFGVSTALAPSLVSSFDPQDNRISTRDGLRVRHLGQRTDFNQLAIRSVFAIRGDGEATLDFDVEKLSTPEAGGGSGLFFEVGLAGSDGHKATVARLAKRDDNQVVMVKLEFGEKNRFEAEYPIGIAPLEGEPTSFRFSRSKNSIGVAVLVENEWIELTKRRCPDGDLFPISLRISTGGARSDLDITLRRLRVSGAELPSDSLVPPEPISRWKVMRWISIGIFCLGILAWVRSRIRKTSG